MVLVLLALMATPGAAWAHVRSTTGTSEIRQDGEQVSYELSVEYELLVTAVGLGQEGLDANSDTERRAVLQRAQTQISRYLEPALLLFLDGVQCQSVIDRTDVRQRQDIAYATVTLSFECPGAAGGSYEVRYGVLAESDAVVDDHSNVADYALGSERGRFVFDNSHRTLTVGQSGLLTSALRFIAMGVEHILAGVDHVLFVVVLLLGARTFRSVLRLAAAFTAAHSLTLAGAAVGWVEVPSQIVEPLIALSIAYLAAENLVGGRSRNSLFVVFGFGLLHGLGFASTLSFTDEISWQLITSLLTFNAGIEIGQALIISLLFPLLLLVRRYRWSRVAHIAAGVLIGTVSLLWFVQRLMA